MKGKIILLWCLLCVVGIIGSTCGSTNKQSEQYSKEKAYKEWIERNYGNGKMESINDAISNYKNK